MTSGSTYHNLADWIDADLSLSPAAYGGLVDLALRLKALPWERKQGHLAGRAVYFMFFNQSMRTRSSFLTGLQKMGGIAIPLDPGSAIYTPALPGHEIPYVTERLADVARVLAQNRRR